jgi:4-alpha-glucanotransferase/(1->4)-alpha-D-glucan 1-alpha-D-glucosylmutase
MTDVALERATDTALEKLAALHGIESGYHDVWGHWRAASPETLRAILRSLGVDADNPAQALAAHERARAAERLPRAIVCRPADLHKGVRLQLPQRALAHTFAWRIVEEDGGSREEPFDPLALPVIEEFAGDTAPVRAFRLPLPADLPAGYHRLEILEGGAPCACAELIVVPATCYLPPAFASGARFWGCSVQLYGVRSRRNAGIGDFTDLRRCAEAWAERGAAFVGTNPLHALSLADPEHASPYSPTSRLFLNPLYIDIAAVEDFAELAAQDSEIVARWEALGAALREGDSVDYTGVAAAKRAMFEKLHGHFLARHVCVPTRRARAFRHFREARGDALRCHAIHEALREHLGKPWPQWPEEYRDPASPAVQRFAAENDERVSLHAYLQWQADLQLAEAHARAKESAMAIGLYADLAVSIALDGSEAWSYRELYALGASVGAPPDAFSPRGQDWGLPPLSPRALRDSAYAPFIATLRANMARAGALRIDHVMGLTRLFWVPHGMEASQGAYVRYPLEDLLGILALESRRHRCVVIGEDLGTVPEDFFRKLQAADVLSYRLLLFERDGDAFKPPASYPRRALVAWSTHDLPTLAGWWAGSDIEARVQAGRIDEAHARDERSARERERAALADALGREKLLAPEWTVEDDLATAVQAYLAATPAAILAVQIEDVLGVREQANLPGTTTEHPNWRRKLPLALEDWARDRRFKRVTAKLGQVRGARHARREAPPGIENARIPRATYRIQLHGGFTFRDARALVPYLAELGVSHVYCSPYLRAREASKHGYDIIDHESLNPELGSPADFEAFVAELKRHGMAQVMDVVPNHMGVMAADNAWWQDVLENGPASALADFFDIDWHPPSEHLGNRVLLPILGEQYGVELAAGKLVLTFEPDEGAFSVRYFTHRLPIDPGEYPRILAGAVRVLEAGGGAHHVQTLRSISDAFARLPRRSTHERARIAERALESNIAKGRLARLARASSEAAAAIGQAVAALNGHAGDAASFDALHELLEAQAFRVAYWRVAQDEINYRRFFDINDLAALRQENDAAFEATHRFVAALVQSGAVEALRIDHPDGLYDPKAYFRRLLQACAKPVYVAVEKIVAPFESVPEDWAVHGTTGYRFANVVNGLFVDPAAESRITRIYQAFVGDRTAYEEITRRSRRSILRDALASELTMLTSRLARISRGDRSTRDFTFTTLRDGLAAVLAAFPVYRTYIDDEVHALDRSHIDWAVTRARAHSRAADVGVFDFIRDALTCELPARTPARAAALRHFARKFQQLSAPVMAKGVEDTAFYIYNRLVSLNDVGGDPAEFGFPVGRFHRASMHRAKHWPHTMLATSTHDNKRSEDVRARIDVISEMAAGWRLQLAKWRTLNARRKIDVDDEPAPSANDEYLLYQILLGSFPAGARGAALGRYRERITEYMLKATREAKVHTSWANPNEAYEAATKSFVHAVLDEHAANPFLDDLRAAVEPVAWIGYLNSLSMVAIKLTSPGVPDCYQGNELWDYSLVDPDNRRPVDYAKRGKLLAELKAAGDSEGAGRAAFANLADGRAKLYLFWRLLQLRREREALFLKGGYTPLRVTGGRARHLVAYARRHGGEVAITVAPRLIASLGVGAGSLPCGAEIWGDTRVELPFLGEGTQLHDVVARRHLAVTDGAIAAADLFAGTPVAVLHVARGA